MLSEFLREAVLLIAVFIPLDLIFSGRSVPGAIVALGMFISSTFLVAGITLERIRR